MFGSSRQTYSTQDKGYKAVHLLKYWEALRKVCCYDDFGAVRKIPLNLIGYSTDGWFLLVRHLMTAFLEEINQDVVHLVLELTTGVIWH